MASNFTSTNPTVNHAQSAQTEAEVATASDFLAAVFRGITEDEHAVVTFKQPGDNDWWSNDAWPGLSPLAMKAAKGAGYICISSVGDAAFCADEGKDWERWHRRKADLVRTFAVVLDDIGTKVDRERVTLTPSFDLETSPGNHQLGYLFKDPCKPGDAETLVDRLIAAGLSDKGMVGAYRVMRFPGSRNTKPQHGGWRAQLKEWRPELRYSIEEIADALELPPPKPKAATFVPPAKGWGVSRWHHPDRSNTDPVWEGLTRRGHVLGAPGSSGWVPIRCPWQHEHGDHSMDGKPDSGVAYRPRVLATGAAFKCHHSSCAHRTWRDVRDYLAR